MKARLNLLKETVLGGVIGASRCVIRHKNEMGNQFRLIKAVYALDGVQILSKADETGRLAEMTDFDIYNGAIQPGSHTISVHLTYQGYGYGVFSYLKNYKFNVRSSNTFGEPIAAVTSYAPSPVPWTGLGPRPMVSYQMAIDGLGGKCNPSYQLQQGNSPEEETAAGMYAKGWAVNIPDHEGEDMEYGAGRNGAHITGAHAFRPLLNGHSHTLPEEPSCERQAHSPIISSREAAGQSPASEFHWYLLQWCRASRRDNTFPRDNP